MTDLNYRAEILFLYDIQNANPNGDPNDENKPRIDEETGRNIVTDVRLKRTIRDYLKANKNEPIFVDEVIYNEEGHIQDAKLRAKDFVKIVGDEGKEDEDLIKKFLSGEKISRKKIEVIKSSIRNNVTKDAIDVRLFGATIPLSFTKNEIIENKEVKSAVTFTGPVQFKMGKSLHSVKMQHIKGTGAFASKSGATQKTFREEYILPYSLIAFSGVINENAAEYTNLRKKDIVLLKDAIWNGTKGLISRSKFGQMPRLLLIINYNLPNFFIGDLDNLIELNTELRDEEIRKPEDYKIEIGALLERIEINKDKIDNIEFISDERMSYLKKGSVYDPKEFDKFTEITL
ncbi:MAG: type I-B CRISPR-associated protein Cas7/Csh2 [Candidatus Lokiarchaeota archaeon]|nr:type I-B CRISPR-associated protein Cas7/Csh2 [Candidatus Lokiarchaeota archaeon]